MINEESARKASALSVLSEREHEVLLLVSEGLRNEEIGQRLYLSPDTVRTHVRNILRQLDLHSRSEAAASC